MNLSLCICCSMLMILSSLVIVLLSFLPSSIFWARSLVLKTLACSTTFLVYRLIIPPLGYLCISPNMPLISLRNLASLSANRVRPLVLPIITFFPMTVLFYLILNPIEVLLGPYNTSLSEGQTYLMLFNRPVST